MGFTQQNCDEILDKLETGVTIETLASEYSTSTGIIELVRLGKCRLRNGVEQAPIVQPINVIDGEPVVRTKCSSEEIDEMAERFKYGESAEEIAKDFNIGKETVRTYLSKRGVERGRYNTSCSVPGLKDFLTQVRKVLFRREGGTDKKTYNEWRGKVHELYKTGDYSKYECQVMAARKFECCRPLFEKYDVSAYDPMAKKGDITGGNAPFEEGSKVTVSERPIDSKLGEDAIECEDKELSYRENLAWAIKAVGNERRTNIKPNTCPNDTAYWLYTQAKKEPRDFLGKLNAIEAKNVNQNDDIGRRAVKRSIEDIDVMLEELVDE